MTPDHDAVRQASRGRKSDYALDPAPIGTGGQAEVFRAVHKPTGQSVAFKRLRSIRSEDAVARMRREVEVAQRLNHPYILPVLDHADDWTWFVMPLAAADLTGRRPALAQKPSSLRRMLEQVCEALDEAHSCGYVHRDIKPGNVLLVQRRPRRWALADWGLVRRPPGETSEPGRTRTGVAYGTEGFAAPELSIDAHGAGAPADVYSLGQLVGWIITGTWPLPNVPLLPSAGPWRTVVREATRREPDRRPQSAGEFATLIGEELDLPPRLPAEVGADLVARAQGGDVAAADELFDLADRHPEDYDVHIDMLPQLSRDAVRSAVRRDFDRAARIAARLAHHLNGDWRGRDFKWADEVIMYLLRVVKTAEDSANWDLLDIAVDAMFDWDDHWDQWTPQRHIRTWLRSIEEEAARIAARSLRRHPDSVRHFGGLAEDSGVDRAIRAVLKP